MCVAGSSACGSSTEQFEGKEERWGEAGKGRRREGETMGDIEIGGWGEVRETKIGVMTYNTD